MLSVTAQKGGPIGPSHEFYSVYSMGSIESCVILLHSLTIIIGQ